MLPGFSALGVDDELGFPGDAAECVAFELDADGVAPEFGAVPGFFHAPIAGVFEVFLVRVGGFSYFAQDQSVSLVVVQTAWLARIVGLGESACRVVGVTLGAAVEVDLFDEAIHRVVCKGRVCAVFVGEADEATCVVELVLLGEPE